MSSKRVVSVRLDDEQHEDLQLIAVINGSDVSELIREAVSDWIETHKKHPSFQEALERHIKRMQNMKV